MFSTCLISPPPLLTFEKQNQVNFDQNIFLNSFSKWFKKTLYSKFNPIQHTLDPPPHPLQNARFPCCSAMSRPICTPKQGQNFLQCRTAGYQIHAGTAKFDPEATALRILSIIHSPNRSQRRLQTSVSQTKLED